VRLVPGGLTQTRRLDVAAAPAELLADDAENETPGSAASGRVCADFRKVMTLPTSTRTGARPSIVRKTGYSRSVASISTTAESSTMTERLLNVCGQIGVMTNAPESGARIGPPALRL
jgi:hypothetical protein